MAGDEVRRGLLWISQMGQVWLSWQAQILGQERVVLEQLIPAVVALGLRSEHGLMVSVKLPGGLHLPLFADMIERELCGGCIYVASPVA